MAQAPAIRDEFDLDTPLGDVPFLRLTPANTGDPAPPRPIRARVLALTAHSAQLAVDHPGLLSTGQHVRLTFDAAHHRDPIAAQVTCVDTQDFRRVLCRVRFDDAAHGPPIDPLPAGQTLEARLLIA